MTLNVITVSTILALLIANDAPDLDSVPIPVRVIVESNKLWTPTQYQFLVIYEHPNSVFTASSFAVTAPTVRHEGLTLTVYIYPPHDAIVLEVYVRTKSKSRVSPWSEPAIMDAD